MNKLALLLFFFVHMSVPPLFAQVKGSPDRCKHEDWAQVDDLLPPRSEKGGYPHPLDPNTQKIAKITPAQILQSAVDHMLTFYDFCGQKVAGVGGWEDMIGTNLCERLALYDTTHEDILSKESEQKAYAHFPSKDLAFLRSIFKACRPTTTRWWNYPLISHVGFTPTETEYAHFRKVLNIPSQE